MNVRKSVSLVAASAFVGASLMMGTAIAHADDPLAPIISGIREIRGYTLCSPLVYNPILEAAAQKYARSENKADAKPTNYPYRTDAYLGSGDPQAAAIGSAYNKGARTSIVDCSFTEFGVGFIRYDDREVDVVTIIFGQPAMPDATPAAPAPAPPPQPAPPVQCPVGSPTATVPAGSTCAPPSTTSVTMAVAGAGLGKINVTLTNSAGIDASCAYTAAPASNPLGILPTINRTASVKARGTAILNENSPPPLTTYHLTVSCTGSVDGKNVELGSPKQDVSG